MTEQAAQNIVSDNPADNNTIHPDVNARPKFLQLLILGLQHVLACYAGAVAVPLFVGSALVDAGRMDPRFIPHLITADLLVAGIATIVQSIGVWRFGVRLPLIQGCTFSAAIPMVTIGTQYGLAAIYGSVICSGIFITVLAPLFSQLLRFFPPLVTGTVLLIIGLTLMPVAADWVGGGAAAKGTPEFGSPHNLGIAAGVLLLILLMERFGPPWLARVSVLAGMITGFLVCIPLHMVDFAHVTSANWVGVTKPFFYGLEFKPAAILAMCIVSLVTMVEATGDVLAIGEVTQTPITKRRIADALRADGFATIVGGCMNTFQYTAFAQNIGVLSITRVKSRYVTATAGGLLMVLGVLPKTAEIIAAIPAPVLGGAGIALFGSVAAAGVRMLSTVRFTTTNIWVVAVPVAIALLPTVSPTLFAGLPPALQTFMSSGICMGSVSAIILNLLFNQHNKAEELVTVEAAAGDGTAAKHL